MGALSLGDTVIGVPVRWSVKTHRLWLLRRANYKWKLNVGDEGSIPPKVLGDRRSSTKMASQ